MEAPKEAMETITQPSETILRLMQLYNQLETQLEQSIAMTKALNKQVLQQQKPLKVRRGIRTRTRGRIYKA